MPSMRQPAEMKEFVALDPELYFAGGVSCALVMTGRLWVNSWCMTSGLSISMLRR